MVKAAEGDCKKKMTLVEEKKSKGQLVRLKVLSNSTITVRGKYTQCWQPVGHVSEYELEIFQKQGT